MREQKAHLSVPRRASATTVEDQGSITPRSAIRYRPIGTGTSTPPVPQPATYVIRQGNKQFVIHTDVPPQLVHQAQQQPHQTHQQRKPQLSQSPYDDEDEERETVPPQPQQDISYAEDENSTLTFGERVGGFFARATVVIGSLMLIMLLGYVVVTWIGNWWTVHQDDVTYGRPRTFQCDAAVGHGTDSNPNSHFIAVNLNRHIEIIEIPGGDPSKSKIYVGSTLMGDNAELLPVTLSFRSVSGNGKPDMIISVRGNTTVMINTGDGFRPVQPDDHINL